MNHHEQQLVTLLGALAIIIVSSQLAGRLAQRHGQPFAVGEIAGGIALGVPTLDALFQMVRRADNGQVRFNIETKISPLAPLSSRAPQGLITAISAPAGRPTEPALRRPDNGLMMNTCALAGLASAASFTGAPASAGGSGRHRGDSRCTDRRLRTGRADEAPRSDLARPDTPLALNPALSQRGRSRRHDRRPQRAGACGA